MKWVVIFFLFALFCCCRFVLVQGFYQSQFTPVSSNKQLDTFNTRIINTAPTGQAEPANTVDTEQYQYTGSDADNELDEWSKADVVSESKNGGLDELSHVALLAEIDSAAADNQRASNPAASKSKSPKPTASKSKFSFTQQFNRWLQRFNEKLNEYNQRLKKHKQQKAKRQQQQYAEYMKFTRKPTAMLVLHPLLDSFSLQHLCPAGFVSTRFEPTCSRWGQVNQALLHVAFLIYLLSDQLRKQQDAMKIMLHLQSQIQFIEDELQFIAYERQEFTRRPPALRLRVLNKVNPRLLRALFKIELILIENVRQGLKRIVENNNQAQHNNPNNSQANQAQNHQQTGVKIEEVTSLFSHPLASRRFFKHFEQWKEKHKKHYKSAADEGQAYNNFEKTIERQMVYKQLNEFNAAQISLDQHADRSVEELSNAKLKLYLGSQYDSNQHRVDLESMFKQWKQHWKKSYSREDEAFAFEMFQQHQLERLSTNQDPRSLHGQLADRPVRMQDFDDKIKH